MDILPQMTARRDSTSAVRRRPASQHSKRVALLRTASAHCTAAVGHRWMHHGLRTWGRSGRRGDGVARPVHRRSVVGADVDSVDFSLRMSHRRTGPVAAGVERPSTTNRPGGNVRLSAEGRLVPHQRFSREGDPRPSRRRDSEPRVRWSRLCEGALSRAVLLRSAAGTCLRSCSYSRSLRTRLNGMGRWISLPLFLRINTNTFIAGKSNPLWQSRFRIQNRLDLISVPVCGDTGIFYISLADPRCPSRSTSR